MEVALYIVTVEVAPRELAWVAKEKTKLIFSTKQPCISNKLKQLTSVTNFIPSTKMKSPPPTAFYLLSPISSPVTITQLLTADNPHPPSQFRPPPKSEIQNFSKIVLDILGQKNPEKVEWTNVTGPIQKQVSCVLDFILEVPMKRNFVQLFIDYIAKIT